MLKYSLLIVISSLLFVGWHCGPPDAPYDAETATELLGDFSFEVNGSPDMQGWSVVDSSSARFVNILKESAGPYSKYSMKLQRDTLTNITPGIKRMIVNKHPYTAKKYVFTCTSKGSGTIAVRITSRSVSNDTLIELNSAEWYRYTFVTFNGSDNTDSIFILLRPASSGSLSYVLFDNLYVKAQKP